MSQGTPTHPQHAVIVVLYSDKASRCCATSLQNYKTCDARVRAQFPQCTPPHTPCTLPHIIATFSGHSYTPTACCNCGTKPTLLNLTQPQHVHAAQLHCRITKHVQHEYVLKFQTLHPPPTPHPPPPPSHTPCSLVSFSSVTPTHPQHAVIVVLDSVTTSRCCTTALQNYKTCTACVLAQFLHCTPPLTPLTLPHSIFPL